MPTTRRLNDVLTMPLTGDRVLSHRGRFDRNPFQLNLPVQMFLENCVRKITSPVLALVVIVLSITGGLVLRWVELGKASFWFDEGYTAWAISLPIHGIIKVISVDTAPPLYYVLLHAWSLLFGRSELGLRSMSALMSSVSLIFFLAVVRRLLESPWARATAISLFSISFMQLAYAHEARFYAMMAMMGVIDLYLVLKACEKTTFSRLFLLVLSWTISLYTNNLMAIYLACLGLAWLLLPGRQTIKNRLRDLALVTVFSGLCFAPWLPTALAQTHRLQGKFWPAAPDFLSLAGAIGVLSGVQEHDQLMRVIFALVITILGFAIIFARSPEQLRRAGAMIAFGLLPVLVIFIYSRVRQSIFVERAFLPSGIAMSLLAGIAVDSARGRAFKFASALAAITLFCLCLRSIPSQLHGEHPENWRDASAFASSSNARHRLVVCVANDGEPLYRYYACRSDYSLRSDVTGAPCSFFAVDPPRTLMQVTDDSQLIPLKKQLETGTFDEVVLIASHTWWGDSDERTLRLVSQRLVQTDKRVFDAITVFRYKPMTR